MVVGNAADLHGLRHLDGFNDEAPDSSSKLRRITSSFVILAIHIPDGCPASTGVATQTDLG